jgi:hypothetical protein
VICPVTDKNHPFPQEQPNQINLFHTGTTNFPV